MNAYKLTVIRTDGARMSSIAYNSKLTIAQVHAACVRWCRRLHGAKFVDIVLTFEGPSDVPDGPGMV